MLRVNGFYGHVRRNDLRSLAMFAGFVVAFQIMAAVVLFLPLLFLDSMHSPIFPLRYAGRYVPIVAILSIALFLLRFSQHVASVRANVDFSYVDRRSDPRLVNLVETLAISAGLPAPKVGMIESSARNAFACGLSAASAVVVVTRGLVEALDDDELAAVAAHEIAHIRNGDIRLMAAANVLMENLDWLQRKRLFRRIGWKQALLVVFLPALLLLSTLSGLLTKLALTIARVSRLLISSSREFVADAEAVRMTHNPSALISALRRIDGRSIVAGLSPQADAMMIDGAVEGPLATHPTIAERIAVLARLSGSWAEAAGPRKDPRVPAAEPAPGPWGVPPPRPWARPAPAQATAASPARLLIQRVNVGANENQGPTRAAQIIIGGGLALIVGSGLLWGMRMNKALERSAPAREAGVKLRKEVERISALHPLDARCFATKFYGVGDRGLHRVHAPDPSLVEAYTHGDVRGSPEITLERYLGLRQRAARAAADARGAELDGALLEYARSRKVLLEVVHRFYGEPGLGLVQEAYDTPQDRAVLATLADRLRDAAQPLAADARALAEMQLLVSEPTAFVPCVARARMPGAQTRPPLRLDTAAFESRPPPGSPNSRGDPRRARSSAPEVG
jgi:Zn-dependent protease with chaperone function